MIACLFPSNAKRMRTVAASSEPILLSILSEREQQQQQRAYPQFGFFFSFSSQSFPFLSSDKFSRRLVNRSNIRIKQGIMYIHHTY